jgi:hypothetical protein
VVPLDLVELPLHLNELPSVVPLDLDELPSVLRHSVVPLDLDELPSVLRSFLRYAEELRH